MAHENDRREPELPLEAILRAAGGLGEAEGPHLDDERVAACAAGTLTDRERASVNRHLARCEPCRRLVAEVARETRLAPVRRLSRWRTLATAAAVIGVLMIGYGLLANRGRDPVRDWIESGDVSRAAEWLVRREASLASFTGKGSPVPDPPRVRSGEANGRVRLLSPDGLILCRHGRPTFEWRWLRNPAEVTRVRVRVRWLEGERELAADDATRLDYPATGRPLPRSERGNGVPIQWSLAYRRDGRENETAPLGFRLASRALLENERDARGRLDRALGRLGHGEGAGVADLRAVLRANWLEGRGLWIEALATLRTVTRPDDPVRERITRLERRLPQR